MPHNAFTPDRQVRFLDCLAASGNVRAACARVGVSHESAYRLRRRDSAFAQGWSAALVLARDAAETVLADRALNGVEEVVYYHGEQIAVRRRFDTRLLLAHLARLDRRAAEDWDGPMHAGRFDELLGVIAGAVPDPDLFAFVDPVDEDAAPLLPMDREEFALRKAQHARVHARQERRAHDDERGEDVHKPCVMENARAEAYVRWDDWRAHACAVVDALAPEADALPMEFKSMGGRPAGDWPCTVSHVSTVRPNKRWAARRSRLC